MLVVFTGGTDNEWQGDPDAKTDDVQLVLDLIDKLGEEYCIDKDKIFAAAKSNGSRFSANILACHHVASKKIAAFAGVAAAYFHGTSDDDRHATTVSIACQPGRKPVRSVEIHGTSNDKSINGRPRRPRCLISRALGLLAMI
ncbi:hypothetical protein B0A50_07338 [Salinomyces thailandicus]|uniref:feruloyl esterase n=1 Tax=Salinomyces thailandicus TaxID=706561 RepID=A0A4U0TMS1_9PEZI|nr:hypothetical protein B0A50_07338 [Salinomyces thailandica]